MDKKIFLVLSQWGKNDQELISFDNQQTSKFERIQLIDGHYYVNLPWYSERIENVPSNHFIAL